MEGLSCFAPVAKAGDDCCHHQKQSDKPTTDCCLNCPLCYVMLMPASLERIGAPVVLREYGVWTSSYVYLYQASCWKPPNAA